MRAHAAPIRDTLRCGRPLEKRVESDRGTATLFKRGHAAGRGLAACEEKVGAMGRRRRHVLHDHVDVTSASDPGTGNRSRLTGLSGTADYRETFARAVVRDTG